jgi:hypothetical protein
LSDLIFLLLLAGALSCAYLAGRKRGIDIGETRAWDAMLPVLQEARRRMAGS